MKGSCEDFCPLNESKLRIKEKVLHFYELHNGQKNVAGLLVKQFARSAAGVKAPRAADLRTEQCLMRTLEYLLKEVLLDKRKSFNHVYDFIFDRLRAIRQEMVIQGYTAGQSVRLLEPIVMFLAYSRYRLCEEPIVNFDTKICEQHLQECLKRVLCCYDEIASQTGTSRSPTMREQSNRNFIESLYQIFNLGSVEALRRGLTLPSCIRQDALYAQVFHIALHHYRGNLYRVLVGLRQLPHILCAMAATKLPSIRRSLYLMCSHAYSSKQATVPAQFVIDLSLHSSAQKFLHDCKHYNVRAVTGEPAAVQFVRGDFRSDAPVVPEKCEKFVEDKLRLIYLPEVLLLKRL